MQKIIIIVVLIFGLQISGYSQWEEKNIMTNSTLTSVDFLDDEIGYVVGGNKIFKTENGGDNWETSFSANDMVFFEDIFIINEDKIIAVGKDIGSNQSTISKTVDGGNNWEIISFSNSAFLKSVYFPSTNVGYCSGGIGTILKSTDSGDTWQELNSGIGINLQSIFFVNDLVGIAVGGTPGSAIILKTQDGGNNWDTINSPTNNNLQSAFFINEDTGYVVGWNGEIIKTVNCGDSWINQTSVAMSGNLEVLFTDNNTGYIVGGQSNESLIQKTINGGELWEDISPEVTEGLLSIFFPFLNVGYAVGSNGTVVKTESGGVITSANNSLLENNIRVYPNPVNDKVWIVSEENEPIKLVKLYDSNGRFVKASTENALQAECDFTRLESNIYYLEIRTGKRNFIKKIIKK